MPQTAAKIIIPDDFPPVISGTPEALMNGLNLCAANVVAVLQGQGQHRVI